MSGYIIASFNIRKLGRSSERDWDGIEKIIIDNKVDILAVQEVFNKEPINNIVNNLNRGGNTWEYRVACSQTCQNSLAEGYAFIWNKKRISLLPEKAGFIEPELLKNYNQYFARPPYIGRFIPIGYCVPFIELRIICTHIIFSKNKYQENKGTSLSDKDLRQKEYQKLIDSIFPKTADLRDGNMRPAYTFISGDYNLSIVHGEIPELQLVNDSREMFTVQKQPTTLRISPENDTAHGYSDNDYDHFSYSGREQEYIHEIARIDAPKDLYSNNFSCYLQKISDHVPVKLLFDVKHNNIIYATLTAAYSGMAKTED